MSNLKNRIASMSKHASAISADMVNQASNISQRASELDSDMQTMIQNFENAGSELSEIDYNEYTQLKDDFERFEKNLKEIQMYMANFASDPGFEQPEE